MENGGKADIQHTGGIRKARFQLKPPQGAVRQNHRDAIQTTLASRGSAAQVLDSGAELLGG